MEDRVKTCVNCRHSFTLIDKKTGRPKYQRCRQSEADENADESLCGVMRRGACGPDAVLWEAK
jgi:hypothetical protein